MNQREFVNGLYPKPKNPKQPDFVIGKLSINLEQFMPWLREWCKANPGEQWINIEMTQQKKDPSKGSASLDTWKPEQKQQDWQTQNSYAPPAEQKMPDEDVPF